MLATTPPSFPQPYVTENLELLKKGMCNMERHIRNACQFGVPTVVAMSVDRNIPFRPASVLAAGHLQHMERAH